MTRTTRRTFATGLAAAGLVPGLARAQQDYPAGLTVKFIVGYPPGGGQDVVGRIVADRMGALWKVPTIVENVAGASANLGMDRVAKGHTDGSQILIVPPNISTNQFMFARMPFNPETDIIPLSLVASLPNLLCVRKDLPVNSVPELIAYCKANPGKLNCASPGIGTTVHLSAELFKRMAGVEWATVHYRGSAPALNDLVGQKTDLMFDNITSIINQARAGGVKPIGITTLGRFPLAPEFVPVADTLPGFDTISFSGVGVRTGTPKAICDRIEADTRTICKDPLLRERLTGLVAETVGSTAAEFAAFIASERAKWGKLIADAKIRVGE
ncbi:MAG TPA: tripartite tricarboxylate transporter substrate-binding protein [Hyphomicrobiaceae bacterium]